MRRRLVDNVLMWAGIFPESKREDVEQEVRENDRERQRSTESLRESAIAYLRENGDGISVQELRDILTMGERHDVDDEG